MAGESPRPGTALRPVCQQARLQSGLAVRIRRQQSFLPHGEFGRHDPSTYLLLRIADSLRAIPAKVRAAAARLGPAARRALP
jgi:hypothetical protein